MAGKSNTRAGAGARGNPTDCRCAAEEIAPGGHTQPERGELVGIAFVTLKEVFANRSCLKKRDAVAAKTIFRGVNSTVRAMEHDDKCECDD